MRLHLFNPGYEASVLLDKSQYTPPTNVQRMQRELALLPLWYADKEEYVWVEHPADLSGFSLLPQMPSWITRQDWETASTLLPPLEAAPWGLSPQIIRFFDDLQKESPGKTLLVTEWKEAYRKLTSRETAALCLQKIKENLPELDIPSVPLFASTVEEIEGFIAFNTPPFVLKTPFSSSGRGLLWIRNKTLSDKEKDWINGALKKQQKISIEKGLDKVQDFAIEFYLDKKGKATYRGLSVFSAPNGSYNSNLLQSQTQLEELLHSFNCQLSIVNFQLTSTIASVYGGTYSGFLGVDMMIYKTENGNFAIHPCVEINMRYTMGMVAIRLFEQYIDPDSTGHFYISYDRDAYARHTELQQAHPAEWKNGKLSKGYLSLCPVTPQTRYRAFIMVNKRT